MLNGALPVWDMDPLRLLLALSRAGWLACLLSGAGALLFRAQEPDLPATVDAYVARLIRASLAAAMVAWLAWVTLQAVVLTGPEFGKMVSVPWQTAFGRFAVAQLALLVLARLTLGLPRFVPVLFAGGAVALQITHLHAWAMEGTFGLLTGSVTLHLLAAAAWLGGVLPLRIAVRYSDPYQAAAMLERFSNRATFWVFVLAVTAFVQGRTLLGGLPGIAGTAYGWVAMGKLVLLAVLLGFAARHRWRLMPRLTRGDAWSAQRSLDRSLALQVVAALLVVTAAALLSALPPAMHAQPVWPFTLQPNFADIGAGTLTGRVALLAGAAMVLAPVLVGLAVLNRPLRWPLLAFAVVLAWFAVPRLSLLLAPATATSFYRSPTGFAATGIAEGAALYPEHCARCHGAEGRGDGPDAASLPIHPADLTAAHVWSRTDGELFGWLTDGIASPDRVPAMPGFATALSDDERWQLIDFVRANNAGLAHVATGAWPVPLMAPDLAADCAGGRSVSLSEMRGKPVRLAFQDTAGDPPRAVPGGAPFTVFVPRPGAAEASGGDCIAADPSVTAAYAAVSGLTPEALAGTDVSIDADGRLGTVSPAAKTIPSK